MASATHLTLPMLRLLLSRAQGRRDFQKPSKPCHIGIHWNALPEYSQMSNHVPGFLLFFLAFLHHIVLAKIAISSIRVNSTNYSHNWRIEWRWQNTLASQRSPKIIVLASRASGCLLDTQTLRNCPSGTPKYFCESFLNMSISSI